MYRARRSAIVAIALSVVLTIVGCFLFLREVGSLLKLEDKQQKTQLVMRNLRSCMQDLQDMETGQRGYLLTGRDLYLIPFHRGSAMLSDNLNELRYRIDVAYPEDKILPIQLAALAREKKNELLRTIRLREEGRLKRAIALVNSDEGKDLMDQIRTLINGHVDKYTSEMTRIKAGIEEHLDVARTLFIFWICAIGTLIASALWNVQNSHRLLKAASDQLAVQAMHDPLTGLPNRRYLNDWLDRAIARGARLQEPVGALYIDLDGFSSINNRLGHEAGDRALLWACELFRKNLRDADFLARLGGDEFLIIACDQDIGQLTQLAQRLIDMMQASAPFGQLPAGVLGASIGIALAPDHAASADELIRQADAAMYAAKKAGKRRYRVASTTAETAPETAVQS